MTDTKPPVPTDEPTDELTDQATGSDDAPATAKPAPPLPSDEPPPPPPAAPVRPPIQHRAVDPMDKSPGLALFLSILFPGLGHIYVANYERALMIIGGIGVSVWAIVHSEGRLWPLAFVIAFAYFFSLFDAFREAQIANLAEDEELPKRRTRGEGRLIFGVFLTVVAMLVLADNLGLFDITWIYDWWPLLILLIGVYFIGSWIWERMSNAGRSDESSYD